MASSSSRTVTKKVLVELGDDSLLVSFTSGLVSDYESLKESIAAKTMLDVDDLVVKVKSEEFGGKWVNLTKEDAVPDKSVVMCVVRTSKVCSYQTRIVKEGYDIALLFLAPDPTTGYIGRYFSYSNYVNTESPSRYWNYHTPK